MRCQEVGGVRVHVAVIIILHHFLPCPQHLPRARQTWHKLSLLSTTWWRKVRLKLAAVQRLVTASRLVALSTLKHGTAASPSALWLGGRGGEREGGTCESLRIAGRATALFVGAHTLCASLPPPPPLSLSWPARSSTVAWRHVLHSASRGTPAPQLARGRNLAVTPVAAKPWEARLALAAPVACCVGLVASRRRRHPPLHQGLGARGAHACGSCGSTNGGAEPVPPWTSL